MSTGMMGLMMGVTGSLPGGGTVVLVFDDEDVEEEEV
jgi:hypothetical protein